MNDVTQTPNADHATFETLETRQMMSGVTFDNGVLTVTGLADKSNNVQIAKDGKNVHAVVNGKTTTYTLAGMKRIDIVGGSQADKLLVDPTLTVPVHMQGLAGNDSMVGGAGNDTLDGGAGVDSMFGSAGNDQFVNADKADKISGGAGVDKTIFAAATTPVPTAGTIASLSLINTDTGKVVSGYENITDGTTLNLAKLPAHLSIAANLASGKSTIRFDYDGKVGYRVETAAPYALASDVAGKYNALSFGIGSHTLTANSLVGGGVLSSETVHFNVIKHAASTTPPVVVLPPVVVPPVVITPPVVTDPAPPVVVSNPTDASAPIAAITAVSKTIPAGTSIHVDALASQLKSGEWNTGHYDWNFGDTKGVAENVMRGFNAAHTYDTAGTYTVSLTVTNDAGKATTTTMNITVTAANRQIIYVSNEGSDSNSGLSTNSPIKTIAKALTLLDDNTEIRFQRGDTFDQTASFTISHSNVVIGAYGIGDRPKILWTGERNNDVMFFVNTGTSNVTVENLSIDTIFNQDTVDHGTPMAFKMGGTNFTARGNELLNLQYGFMLNMNPNGVMIQNNTAPSETGLRKYFAWVQGTDVTIVGNFAANSTREHIVRVNFASKLNVSDNDFSNISRRDDGDYWDYRKTAVNVQSGSFAYVYGNKLNASLQVGPLGQTEGDSGQDSASMRFNYFIAEDNNVINDQIVVNHGAQHITFRDNVVHDDNALGFNVDGYSTDYQRGVVDLTLQNNTVVNNGTQGSFIDVYGAVDGIVMTDNLYIAPHLQIGSYGTAAVKLAPGAYDSFTEIDGNVWPVAASVSKWVGKDAINYIGDGYTADGLQTAAEWNSLGVVGNDASENVNLPADTYNLVLNGIQVGADLAA